MPQAPPVRSTGQFIDELDSDGEDSTIGRARVGMADALGLGVVAEGVETPDRLEVLRTLDVDLAQGFLLGRPAPATRPARGPRRDSATRA